mgnify:CR=1 FL=1
MEKAHSGMTLTQLKEYVREHKLQKSAEGIKLTMKKSDLIAGLKKHGHWTGTFNVKNTKVATVKTKPTAKPHVKVKSPPKPKKRSKRDAEFFETYVFIIILIRMKKCGARKSK